MDVQPDDARKALIDTLFSNLKSGGVLTKLDALWLMAAHTSQAARLNLRSASYDLSAISSPPFIVDRGYAGDGSASYLKTGLVLSTATNFAQNSAAFGFWSLTDAQGDSFVMGARVSSSLQQNVIAPRRAGSKADARVNVGPSPPAVASANSLGLFSGSRTGSTTTTMFKNGASIGSYAASSVEPPALEMYLLGCNTNGELSLPSNRRGAAAFVGAGLTNGEMLALYNALNTYLTALGAV